eukprot:TRINITY_DN20578_c0_g2_i1.p1 TRINITY_DN20578_c0_g2~~TRINITY_DN20578_c0_g2_i1.p1  ORF type:complete len:397 (-),score=70.01 TRINITY_DN20578_c0_g2_i1:220-1410(-)
MTEVGGRRCFRSSGQIYFGDVDEKEDGSCIRHGLGLQIVTAETVKGENVVWGRYQGSWKKDAITGSGVYRWSDGSVYEGCFLNGRPHGHGRLKWPDGSSYDGSWYDGELHGQGTFVCGYDGIESHGIFRRNCLRQHDGTWLDLVRRREERRVLSLSIGADMEVSLPIQRCTPQEVHACVEDVLRQPPYMVPLVLATTSCPAASGGSAAPLWCLEAAENGCTAATTVHLSHAADLKQRQRDFAPVFRDAIREALLTYRPLGLVFGDDANPQDEDADGPAPKNWSLREFFDRLTLPLDIFDLRHFHGSGMADLFLPLEKQGLVGKPAPQEAAGEDDEEPTPAHPPLLLPPTLNLLNVALVSLKRISDEGDDSVRKHVRGRFSAMAPLHRLSIIVVSSE